MKIAFDGTVLHGHKSGVGYYCEDLLKAMLAVNDDDQFVVFSHRPLTLDFGKSNPNLQFTNSRHFPIRAFYLHALLPKILNRVQPDLCHYTNFLAPVSDDRPYVVTIHDMGLEVLRHCHPLAKRLYTKSLIPHVARKAKLVITNSEYSKWEIVRHLGISQDRIRVTPLAAAPEFAPAPRRSLSRPYFLYVGNLEPRKNLERLIEAFARMPQKDHELVIVGNHWYRGETVQEKARALGLNGRVKFPGYVPREDLPGWFSNATAFVYPSLLEGFGLPVIEAMACGAPVITSDNSGMKEIAGDAAILIDPLDVRDMTEALTRVAEDESLRAQMSVRGLSRAAQFSWESTARSTLDVYHEASGSLSRKLKAKPSVAEIQDAVEKTVQYAQLFQYPLMPDEIRERLFEVCVDERSFNVVMRSIRYRPDPHLLALRAERERLSDDAIRDVEPQLRTLASIPFVRMIAFSGSTAHRNMTNAEDIDLFMIVEKGKAWAVFLVAVLWAKAKGIRKKLCMNYIITDAALHLVEQDAFTAQQVAALKPIYGKSVYDRFVEANPFVERWFPNFDPSMHRGAYPEIPTSSWKRRLETLLRIGAIQIVEGVSRVGMRWHLSRKIGRTSDVQLDRHRLKLHLQSHKQSILDSVSVEHAGDPRT
jgi:glycosyltransferase involved in cell wall biosynthesis